MDIFTVLLYQPIFNLMIVLYRLFSENLGLAIISVAILSRLITLPISLRQMKMMKTNNEMSAKIKEIKKKHKNDKEAQQKEIMKIQSEYLPSQLAGCLPVILQFIFLINVYNVINNLIQHGAESFNTVAYPFIEKFSPDYVVHTNFLGLVDLKSAASQFSFDNLGQILPYLVLIALVGITQYFSMKMMTNKPAEKEVEEKKDSKSKNKQKGKKEDAPEDFSAIIQQSTKQTAMLFPIMVSFISFSLAAGLSLYWIAQSSFVIIQQLIMKRRDPNNAVPVV